MLTVDCTDVDPIKHELVVYVSDQVGAIPTLKRHDFTLSPIDDDETIDRQVVITAIKEYLNSIGEARNFAVISSSDTILIKSVSGKTIERKPKPVEQMFSCPHCGFVTQYEIEHNNHMKIHYL